LTLTQCGVRPEPHGVDQDRACGQVSFCNSPGNERAAARRPGNEGIVA
jgi:hypothetical protein